MPTCSHCGGDIDCPAHAHVVGHNVETCALQKGALWIQVVDDKGDGVEGVDVTLDGGSGKQTDPQGLAAYDPLADQAYTAGMSDTLPGSVTATHKPPVSRTKPATVEQGKIAFVKFQLLRKKPRLEVVPSHAFADAVVGLSVVKVLQVKNIGDADLEIHTLTFPPHFPAGPGNLLADGAKIKPGESAELEASFKPTAAGDLAADLVIASNDPDVASSKVALTGKAIPPWTLSVAVTSDKRAKVGAVESAWVEGDVEVGLSASKDDHAHAVKMVTKAVIQVDEGKFTLADVHTGTAKATFHVWARAKSGAWQSRGDVEITIDPGETKTVAVDMKALVAKVSLFRGAKALAVVPFSTTDIDKVLDAAIEDGDNGVAQDPRPGKYDAAFTFPLATSFADDANGNADTALWRLRVKLDAIPDVPAPVDVTAVVKVVAFDGRPITDAAFGNGTFRAGIACHAAGMQVALEAAKGDEWVTPYCRVVTTSETRDKTCVVVHSLGPYDNPAGFPADKTTPLECKAIMDAGKQFGRKLVVEGTLYGAPFTAELVMGGEPYARVPVKLCLATSDGADLNNKLKRLARVKVHQLNAWWAGQGVEFELVDAATPVHTIVAPPRRLVTVGEHTGPATVSSVDFQLDLKVKITATGKNEHEETITIAIAKDQTPAQVAQRIKTGIEAFVPVEVDHLGIELAATVHDLGGPRAFLVPTPFPGTAALPLLGTQGPSDVVLSVKTGAVDALAVSGLAVTPGNAGIDIHAPPTARPYHEAVFSPPAATTRQWVRAFGGGLANHVAVILEGNGHAYYGPNEGYPKSLCEPGYSSLAADDVHALMEGALRPAQLAGTVNNAESKSRALTVLSFGRWTEPCAAFTMFLANAVFGRGTDDLQHEMGHALSDLDHTINDPDWFYKGELLHTGSAKPANALKITKHKIHVSHLRNDAGTWKFAYTELPTGYGGAVRDFIDTHRNGWVIDDAWNGWS